MEENENNTPVVDETSFVETTQTEQPAAENPAAEAPKAECACVEPKKCCPLNTILLIVALAGLAVLYVLHFTGAGTHSKHNPNATAPIVSAEGGLKIAFIDTDTLMAKYEYAKDLSEELNEYQKQQENSYKQQITQFQTDYNNYLQNGTKYTLSQQKAKEEEWQKRAEKLSTLEQELGMRIQERTMKESEKMTNAVYAFIREYNAANQQFDLILAKSFTNTPLLYANPGMDITNEIVEGLNAEYAQVKEK